MLKREQAARLLSTDAQGRGPRLVLLGRKSGLIGRRPESLVALDDARIADAHARIEYRRGRYAVADLRSEAGTSVNGRRVRRRRLRHGDLIRLGGAVSYRFIDPDAYLRRRWRRAATGAIALSAVIAVVALHLKGWDGGLLSAANFERGAPQVRPAAGASAEASPVMREAVAVATPAAAGLRHFELSGPPVGGGETVQAGPEAGAYEADGVGAEEERADHDGRKTSSWQDQFNQYRAAVHESAVAENPQLSAAMASHARYVIDNYRAQIKKGAGLGEAALTESRNLAGYSAQPGELGLRRVRGVARDL